MGIEYRQFLVVNDAKWLPGPETASRVVKVLREWGLAEKLREAFQLTTNGQKLKRTEAFDLTDGNEIPISEKEIAGHPGHGKAFVFAGVRGPQVERIAGPSAYKNVVYRYTYYTGLVLGTDYRVCSSNDFIYFKLVSPPHKGRKPIAPHFVEDPFRPGQPRPPLHRFWDQSFPCDEKTSPPTVELVMEKELEKQVTWTGLLGYWRGALVIEFNKDVPAFAEKIQVLPNRRFVRDIEDAFGARIEEIGEYY